MSATPKDGGVRSAEAGTSLVELLIATAVTLVIMTTASTFLTKSLNMRTREDRRAEALADAQYALNLMAREIANSGMGLPKGLTYTPPGGGATIVPSNGLLPAFCDGDSLALVTNNNAFAGTGNADVSGADEAVLFSRIDDPANSRSYLARQDLNTNNVFVLANRVDAVQFIYIDRNPATGALAALAAGSSPTANTVGVRITVTATLPSVGSVQSPGFQPVAQTQLVSEVVLRNAILNQY